MGKTSNHNYDKPSKGTADWHIPLNQNFEDLDLDIEIRGPEADKSDNEPKVGAKYEATDSGAVYYGNGDSWILANRRVNKLQAESVAAKQLQGKKGPLIVSPSISEGYDSLQTALNEAAAGPVREIWIAEDIEENTTIPNSTYNDDNWFSRSGLKIRGIAGRQTNIKDAEKDGTPIMDVEDGGAGMLALDSLKFEASGTNTRAFSADRYEKDTTASLQLAHFSNCTFRAPVILSKVYHGYFENTRFRPDVGCERHNMDETIYPGLQINAGNQYMFDRCQFADRTGEVKYGTCWMSGANSAVFNSCFFTITDFGYNDTASRPTAPLLIDTGGDFIFNLPYTEQGGDYAMVTDAISGGGNIIDNIYIYGSRLGGIKLNNYVNGFVMEGLFQGHTINLEDGVAGEGSYVHTTKPNYPSNVDVVGDNGGTLRVIGGRQAGWNVTTPSVPVSGNAGRVNKTGKKVAIYVEGGGDARIRDYSGNERFVPASANPIILDLNEQIYYEDEYPTSWDWFALE